MRIEQLHLSDEDWLEVRWRSHGRECRVFISADSFGDREVCMTGDVDIREPHETYFHRGKVAVMRGKDES